VLLSGHRRAEAAVQPLRMAPGLVVSHVVGPPVGRVGRLQEEKRAGQNSARVGGQCLTARLRQRGAWYRQAMPRSYPSQCSRQRQDDVRLRGDGCKLALWAQLALRVINAALERLLTGYQLVHQPTQGGHAAGVHRSSRGRR
jgi:hypothetical protein